MSNRPSTPRSDLDDDPDKTVLATARLGDASTRPNAPLSTAGSSNNTLPLGLRVAEFEITGVIGEGGFGIVYRAYDHQLRRLVALKEYMPSALASRQPDRSVSVKSDQHIETFLTGLRSFINEAQLLAQFDHPSLVKVFRFWEANKTAYMVMPLYEGSTLKQALKARIAQGLGPPSEAWLRNLLVPLLDALETLHAADCLHRDIAPDNVLLLGDDKTASGDPRPILLDFGAARRVIGESTQALTVILKPGYAPIEQYDEIPSMKQGPWTDMYALAAVIHYAIVGKAPPQSVGRLVRDQYVPLAHLDGGRYGERYSASFLAAIDAALAPRPGARPQSAAQFRTLLAAPEVPTPAVSPPSSPSPPIRPQTVAPVRSISRKKRAWGALIWLGTGMFVLFVALGVLLLDWLSLHDSGGGKSVAPNKSSRASLATESARSEPPTAVATVPLAQPEAADKPAASAVASLDVPSAPKAAEPVATKPGLSEKSVDRADQSRPAMATGRRPPPRAQRRTVTPSVVAKAEPRKAPTTTPRRPAPANPDVTGADGHSLPLTVALRDARICLIERRFSCTIQLADDALKNDPGNTEALELARLARRGQEEVLSSDWKVR